MQKEPQGVKPSQEHIYIYIYMDSYGGDMHISNCFFQSNFNGNPKC